MNWQDLLKKGNNHFDEQQWTKAELYYKSAFSQLEGMWSRSEQHESLLMAWICTCHNLGTLFESTGEYQRSIGYFVQAYQETRRTSQNQSESQSLRNLAFGALSMTLNPILTFAQKYPTCEHCVVELQRLKQTLDYDTNVIH